MQPRVRPGVVVTEPAIGVLLPCNVVVRVADGDAVVIDLMDPAVTLDLVGEERVNEIAKEVRTNFEMVRDALGTTPAAA